VYLSTGLISQLQELTVSIGGHNHAVDASLAALVVDLEVAVPSYCGLRLTITQNGFPIVLTSFAELEAPVGTSLRLQLSLVDPAFEVGSQVVFYARSPGAFVDLAADLSYVLGDAHTMGRERSENHRGNGFGQVDGHRRSIELDADLPPTTRVSGLSGLAGLSTINRDVGVMIARGHHPDNAHETLRQHAASSGLEPHAWAIRLLQS
jgi:hypothetical protein